MVRKLDAGDVIGERRIKISSEINSLELHDQLALLGADLLRVELMDYVRGNAAPKPQDESKVTYAKKIDKSEALLDWSLDSRAVHDRIRAFVWGPGTHTFFQGKRLKIHKARVADGAGRPGEILRADEKGLVVACGRGALEILSLQPESRTVMSSADFMKSQTLAAGLVLGS
ncbi:MAG TPA: hypothetical protein PL182_04085 [Pseudobdellovibrionaceae bacterium]|nr:hypothetical protein [Pseudobdellovibrionaceae bacterium]